MGGVCWAAGPTVKRSQPLGWVWRIVATLAGSLQQSMMETRRGLLGGWVNSDCPLGLWVEVWQHLASSVVSRAWPLLTALGRSLPDLNLS